jgi:hypothetical protein
MFGNHNNIAWRFVNSKKSNIYENFVKKIHAINKCNLNDNIYLLIILFTSNFWQSLSNLIKVYSACYWEKQIVFLLNFCLILNIMRLAESSKFWCYKDGSHILIFNNLLNLIIIEQGLFFYNFFAILNLDKVRKSRFRVTNYNSERKIIFSFHLFLNEFLK